MLFLNDYKVENELEINKEQTTLTSLLNVKNAQMCIQTFNLDPVIDLWVSTAKTKKNVIGKEALASSTNPAFQSQHEAKEGNDKRRDQISILPPLPRLLDSDADTD